MGGKGSGRVGQLTVQSRLPRLDAFDLADRGVFDVGVAAGEFEWPRLAFSVRFESQDDGLVITAPFVQLLPTVRRVTPTAGEFRHFLCPRCDSERRVLYVVPRVDTCGCRACLSVTYQSSNASGSPKNKAIARYKSLKRGRRRPRGGQPAHEERLRRAGEDALRKIWSPGEALLHELWGIEEPRPDPFDDAIREEWRAAFPRASSRPSFALSAQTNEPIDRK